MDRVIVDFSRVSPLQEKKELALGYGLWCLSLVGICGVQRLYLGHVGYGIALMLTFGFCGVAQLLDLILLPDAVRQANRSNASPASAPVPVPLPTSAPVIAPLRASAAPEGRRQDDDLDVLLREANQSLERVDLSNEQPPA